MLYAERDADGVIVAIRKIAESEAAAAGKERIGTSELVGFLAESEARLPYERLLAQLDTDVIRVLDDLVDLLVRKNVILFTDLPEEARQKLYERKRVRHKMQEQQLLTDDIV